MPDPVALWAALNERQQTYLRAVYDCDQAKEAGRRLDAARGYIFDRTPASEWRWVMYGPTGPPSELHMKLHTAGLVDPGTGSTWKALEDRGLIETGEIPDAFGIRLLRIKITPKGRKVVRAGTGEHGYKAPPKGQLRERQWECLAALYAAGDAGLGDLALPFDWWYTIRRLDEYKPKPLAEAWHPTRHRGLDHFERRITEAGRAYYEREWARYRALYPDVEAAEPRTNFDIP